MTTSSSSTSTNSTNITNNSYATIQASFDATNSGSTNNNNGNDNNTTVILSRVEVNQRALIDKILARYASQGAVYRELIQNSNDADATEAEILFTTSTSTSSSDSSSSSSNVVTQVIYRNNGMPFRLQDWDRLKKIAEGNPDVSKVGAFGVGAYTMFSICEEPYVISGNSALQFIWQGDTLWTKTIPMKQQQQQQQQQHETTKWTSFILPSRDPYTVPNLVQFGEFLCASLTFTAKLKSIKVYVNDELKLHIQKTIAQPPRLVQTPKSNNNATSNAASSLLTMIWNGATGSGSNSIGDDTTAITSSTKGLFTLAKIKDPHNSTTNTNSIVPAIYESIHRMTVTIDNCTASLDARYVTATAKTNIPSDMARRMERVTKKNPPATVDIHIFLNAAEFHPNRQRSANNNNKAARIVQSFLPRTGQGRIFIGFRTSQTTGLAAHLAAPFVPTVEREAMDLQDTALRLFNTELLEFSGILMRLTLEHTMMNVIGYEYAKNAPERLKLEQELLAKINSTNKDYVASDSTDSTTKRKTLNETHDNDDDNDDDAGFVDDDDDDGDDNGTTTATRGSSKGGLMGFARFMARGVTKSIVSVAKTVGNLVVESNTAVDPLLYPPDPRPLCYEEKQAIVLMQAFCPQQSTPDATVGTYLATGFSRCLPNQSPPVLTRSGVVRGDLARLPNYGIESFCVANTIRSVVYQNCSEYHTVIARCRKLSLDDLYESISNQIFEEDTAVRLIHWWIKYSRVEPIDSIQNGLQLKQLIKFYPTDPVPSPTKNTTTTNTNVVVVAERPVVELKQYWYYYDKESYFAAQTILPLPETVLPRRLHTKIGYTSLTDGSLCRWFNTLPVEVWAEYISTTSYMTDGKPEDELIRIQILACLCQEYMKRVHQERIVFGGFIHSLLANQRCISFDSTEPTQYCTDYPADLYLPSAELKAFQGIGGSSTFRKVAASLQHAGVTDDFLLALGVRKSVSIDFLLTNLGTLRWTDDPKPLIEYLRTATLSRNDVSKLSTTQYLPAENDTIRMYAPSQLYLPNAELRIFPFVKMLKWPSEPEVSEKSSNGQFMIKLGFKTLPPLEHMLEYISNPTLPSSDRIKCLDVICDRLGPHGSYHASYNRMNYQQKKQYRFLPCRQYDPIEACFVGSAEQHKPATSTSTNNQTTQLHSPITCFSDEICGIMGFPVIDPNQMGNKNSKLYGSLLQCEAEPGANFLLHELMQLVTRAKKKLETTKPTPDSATLVDATFVSIFKYLSHRSSDINLSSLEPLKRTAFIPVKTGDSTIEWFRPDQVFFQRKEGNQDSITSELFRIIDFNAFLSAVGVKEEASTKDLFIKILSDPADVLRILGNEKKYRSLLRRIAANPPFPPSRIPAEVKNSPFLLGYEVKYGEKKDDKSNTESQEITTHHLAKASDIYIIDNSFFARMFPVKRAPPESDLEDFYAKLGSRYISQSVDRRFELVGKAMSDTPLTRAFRERLSERGPLLVSPNITSRPLVQNAASLLESKNLQVFEVNNLLAVYSLSGTTRRNRTTCCSRGISNNSNAIYLIRDFDWFDVGYAIGDLILKRCQLEDAFFISSLLEAPLEQLRARGFPVDRILQSEPVVPDSPKRVDQVEVPQPMPPAQKSQPPQISPTIVSVPPQRPPSSGSTGVAPDSSSVSSSSSIGPSTNPKPPATQQPSSVKSLPNNTNSKPPSNEISLDGMHQILLQMFPDADPKFVMAALGKNPTKEDLRNLAESMAAGNYPKTKSDNDDSSVAERARKPPTESRPDKKSSGLRKKLGRALGFGGGSSASINSNMSNVTQAMNEFAQGAGGTIMPPSSHGSQQNVSEQRKPVSPANDAQTQHQLEQMLENTIDQSAKVNPGGIHSNEVKLTSIPSELDHDCEVIPGQSLKPFPGPRGNGKTRNGIRVFSSRPDPESEFFLSEYDPVLESFAHVLERLCVGVFGLNVESLAIFHDPSSKTIAFNSNRALHFNIRYFYSLHFLLNKHMGIDCYSYWYMTIAHELAHHMVSAHTREHGFFTESYATLYLPKLVILLNDL